MGKRGCFEAFGDGNDAGSRKKAPVKKAPAQHLEMNVQQYEKQGAKKAKPTTKDYGEKGRGKTADEKISILCSSFAAYMADNFDVRASHALPVSRFLVTYQKLRDEKEEEEEEKTAAAAVKANDEPS